jgi:hypothetical protein
MSGFRFNIDKLIKLQRILGSPDGAAQMRPLYELWGKRYLSFVKRKFVENSAGGGDWPDLADSTMAERMREAYHTKRGRKMRQIMKAYGLHGDERTEFIGENLSVAILQDKGLLLRALNVGAQGNLFQPHTFGIKVGIGGPARHGDDDATIGDIAAYHNEGGGRLPKRQIIWPPDDDFKMFMLQTLRNHINNIGRSL